MDSLKNNLRNGCLFGGLSLAFGLAGTIGTKMSTKLSYPWATSFICMASTTATGAGLFAVGLCSKNFHMINRKELTLFFLSHMTTTAYLTHLISKWWIQPNVPLVHSARHTVLTNLPLYALLSLMALCKLKT